MNIKPNKPFSKGLLLTLLIMAIGIGLLFYYYPDLHQKQDEHEGLLRYSPYKGFALGVFCFGYAIFDLVRFFKRDNSAKT